MKAILLMILKRAGEAIVAVVIEKLLTKELFESSAVWAIEVIARKLAASTETDIDDRFVETELLPRLHRDPGDREGA